MPEHHLNLHLAILPPSQRRLWDELGRVPAFFVPYDGIALASLLDIAATKAAVIQVRAEAKDYLDIDALIRSGGIDLPTALAAACALYGTTFNPQITLKALSYFEDGDVARLPPEIKERLAIAARSVDLDNLPVISSQRSAQESQQ